MQNEELNGQNDEEFDVHRTEAFDDTDEFSRELVAEIAQEQQKLLIQRLKNPTCTQMRTVAPIPLNLDTLIVCKRRSHRI